MYRNLSIMETEMTGVLCMPAYVATVSSLPASDGCPLELKIAQMRHNRKEN
jgi:hypothetical protein